MTNFQIYTIFFAFIYVFAQNQDNTPLSKSHLEVEPATQTAAQNNPLDITFTRHPGIYEIRDTINDILYYGETSFLAKRWEMHWERLKTGTHENPRLLKAFKAANNLDAFRFIVLEYGPEWADSSKRLAKETEYIQKSAHRCYNVDQSLPSETGIIITPIMLFGKRYESIRDASRIGGYSRSQIKRWLANKTKTDCYYLEEEATPFGEIPIFAQKGDGPSVLFASMGACVKAGYAPNIQNARRNIKRGEKGWRYAALDLNNKPIRRPYTLKPGEIYFEILQQFFIEEDNKMESSAEILSDES